jgi:hypothetical protein
MAAAPAGGSGDGTAAHGRALEWLRPRLDDGVPSDLAQAVRACVRAAEAEPGTPVPELLARAAVSELDRLGDRPADRETAVRLLAADAALTYAFEAAAEAGADVPALADEVGLRGLIGRRLAGLTGEEGA